MVGYYPQLQEGELLYSATARLAAAIFPNRCRRYCAKRILGDADFTFGFLIPNHVDGLLANIPPVTSLSSEAVLSASTFHIQSTLLDEDERSNLFGSVFGTGLIPGRRSFGARGVSTVPKYCVACARRDADLGKPAYWRVVPNHHGSFACAEHGIRLQTSDATFESDTLIDPATWIRLDVPQPPMATGAEQAMAKDLAWIYEQQGAMTPGYRPIALKLQDALLARPEFTFRYGFIDPPKLLEAARDSLGEQAWRTFAPQFSQLARGRTMQVNFRTSLQFYCLYAYLAGTSLKQILTDLAAENSTGAAALAHERHRDARVSFHKKRILDFIAAHPGCTRSHVRGALPGAAEVTQSADREWYERHMPEPLSNRSRGRRLYRDWADRDDKLCARVADYMNAAGALPFRSRREALQKLGQSRNLLLRERGRLPRFRALIESSIASWHAAA